MVLSTSYLQGRPSMIPATGVKPTAIDLSGKEAGHPPAACPACCTGPAAAAPAQPPALQQHGSAHSCCWSSTLPGGNNRIALGHQMHQFKFPNQHSAPAPPHHHPTWVHPAAPSSSAIDTSSCCATQIMMSWRCALASHRRYRSFICLQGSKGQGVIEASCAAVGGKQGSAARHSRHALHPAFQPTW